MMMNMSKLDLLADVAEWVQKMEQIAEMNNVEVEDDYEFAFMNYMKDLGKEKPSSSSLDIVACAPSNTAKPYDVSVPNLNNIPKRRRTTNLQNPNKLKRSVSGIEDSVHAKSKRRKVAKESKTDGNDHPFLLPLTRTLVIIPPRPRPEQGPPVLPVIFRNKIEEMRGFDIQIVIQKELTPTDVNSGQACLSIPVSKINENNFLTEIERADLKTIIEGRPYGLAVPLIDPELRCTNKSLKWRSMEKAKGKSNPKYVLTSKWNDLVADNQLKEGEVIQLWSFRVRSDNSDLPPQLHFALVRV